MENSPLSESSDVKTTTPSGVAAATVKASATSVPTLSQAEEQLAAAVSGRPDEPSEKLQYEFSYTSGGEAPTFVVLWDTDDLSACQRVTCSPIAKEIITYDPQTGLGFLQHDCLRWCFKKQPERRSASFRCGIAESELVARVTITKPSKVDDILHGLL